ncbi:MAG: cytochrome c3 family protein [Desulfobacterales bacterium]|nr:cytochrome c3 family protein [Desulfobacterales bacterium]
MKKNILFIFSILTVYLLIIVSAHSQEDMKFVNADAFKNVRRTPAVFRHDEHNELAQIEECNQCHHAYNDDGKLLEDESSEDRRCSDCHDLKASGGRPALMKAYHLNCKGCHKARKDGPTMCGQCHVRNSPRTDQLQS